MAHQFPLFSDMGKMMLFGLLTTEEPSETNEMGLVGLTCE